MATLLVSPLAHEVLSDLCYLRAQFAIAEQEARYPQNKSPFHHFCYEQAQHALNESLVRLVMSKHNMP
jgi:hypothetical protein